jgi:broad specificity phosphatase PhoE
VTTVLLVRHGLTAITGKILLGWTPGVPLDDRGRRQARELAERLASIPLAAVVSSPLERCRQTAAEVAARRTAPPAGGSGGSGGSGGAGAAGGVDAGRGTAEAAAGTGGGADAGVGAGGSGGAAGPADVHIDDRLGECHYGDWTGRELAVLAKDPLWRTVQEHPSAVVFPGPAGEALRETQARGVAAVRDWNDRLGPDATWLACSHADVIKAIAADAMGMHLDLYQRIVVDPCSLTVIRYTERRPFVLRINDVGGSVADLLAAAQPPTAGETQPRSAGGHGGADGDAVVGGGSGGDYRTPTK